MNRRIAILLLCLAPICLRAQEKSAPVELSPTEYQILSMCLNERVVKQAAKEGGKPLQQVVIADKTSTGIPPGAAAMTQMRDEETAQIFKEAPELVKSLVALNKQNATVDGAKLAISAKAIVVSGADLEKIFKGPKMWEEFYKRYANSQGVSYVSRVAFSEKNDLAIAYIGTMSGMLAGEGELILLEKRGGEWVIKHHGMVWVS